MVMEYRLDSARKVIRASITNVDGGKFKVVWDDGELQFSPYLIDSDMINGYANELRMSLRHLVEDGMNCEFHNQERIINEIAVNGRKLFDALFYKDHGSIEDPEVILEWIANFTEDIRIVFVVDGFIHVPWHLIFDGNPSELSDAEIDDEGYNSFWCKKFQVTCQSRMISPRISDTRSDDKFCDLIPICDRVEIESNAAHIPSDELERIKARIKWQEPPTSSLSQLQKTWETCSSQNRILYFYSHANGSQIALNDTESIDIKGFKRNLRFKEGAKNSSALTILNGCSTAVGAETKGFIEATSMPGHCGFIGTETDIPIVYALRFGNALLECLYETGWPLYEAMSALRLQNWPMSLVYGVYAHAHFQAQPTTLSESWTQEDNFCNGPAGGQVI